jgi:hypothetical protein
MSWAVRIAPRINLRHLHLQAGCHARAPGTSVSNKRFLFMEYKGIEYRVMQKAGPSGWRWELSSNVNKTKTGESYSRASAVLHAERAIDKILRDLARPAGDGALSRKA